MEGRSGHISGWPLGPSGLAGVPTGEEGQVCKDVREREQKL